MSTQQVVAKQPASDVVAKIDKWNDEHFKLARETLKKLGPAPYPRTKEFDQNLAGIKKLPIEDRAAKYTDELLPLQSLGQKLLADKSLESDAKKPIALDIKAAKEKINAELSADALEIKNKTATPVQPSTSGPTGGPTGGPHRRPDHGSKSSADPPAVRRAAQLADQPQDPSGRRPRETPLSRTCSRTASSRPTCFTCPTPCRPRSSKACACSTTM